MPKTAMYGSDKLCTMDLDYKLLKQALIDFYKPQNPVEEVLVERIAVLDWRLKRNVLAERKVVNIRPGRESFLPPADVLEQILKYDRTADKELHRAISALEQIREKKEKKEAPKGPVHAQKGAEADHENESGVLKSESGVLKNESRDSPEIPVSESALETVFSSSARVKILRLFLNENQSRFYLREISAKAGVWLGTVQREVTKLTDAGVLVKEVSGQQTYYRVNDRCPITAGLRHLFK